MKKISLAVVGLGQRGKHLLEKILLKFNDVTIVAVCDLYEDRVAEEVAAVKAAHGNTPLGTTDYREALRKKPDAVMVFTAWESHVEIAVAAMQAGCAVGMEVGGAYSVADCERLVRVQEATGMPFMFLENCCFNKDELLATALARSGKLGEIVYCEGQYAHDLRYEVSHGKELRHYRLRNYLSRNCENYPTHELLPIAKVLNINRGNRMVSLVSVASKSAGLPAYIAKHADEVDPALHGATFAQGDVVDTIITCANGETIHLRLDTTLPRFYDRGFTLRGTEGMYSQTLNGVWLDADDNTEYYEPMPSVRMLLDNAKKYEEEYLPEVWKKITPEELEAGHGGMDAIELRIFVDALKNGEEMPLDVYDAATVMVVSVLSEQSIALGGAPVAFPDFTSGAWLYREKKDVLPL